MQNVSSNDARHARLADLPTSPSFSMAADPEGLHEFASPATTTLSDRRERLAFPDADFFNAFEDDVDESDMDGSGTPDQLGASSS